MQKRVAVAMSGGVDRSVTAALLKRKGYDVIGITMRLWDGEAAEKSATDAKAVADILGIPHDTLDFSDTFRHDVVEYFIDAYGRGKTPNPCVACNRCVKFGRLWDEARRRGADLLATGHYARTAYDAERGVYTLLRGSDRRKDQSYVLYQLTQDLLPHVLFPMADFEKSDTRAMAQEWGLPVFNKPESQDICFIPDNDYKGFLRRERAAMFKTGNFVDADGRVVGRHEGIPAYTIGQRRGLNLGGPGGPYYVTALDVARKQVVVGSNDDLFSAEVRAEGVSWVEGEPEERFRALGKIRYAAKESPCTVQLEENGRICVTFDQPQRAVTAGQALVLYDAETGDRVLGGGIIM